MRFPEWLYKLLPGDAGTQLLGLRQISVSQSIAGASTTKSIQTPAVPQDKVLVVTNMCARVEPNGAQSVNRIRLILESPLGSTRYDVAAQMPNAALGVPQHVNWSGEIAVPGGWQLKLEIISSGLAADTLDLDVLGYQIPRGSFIFG